MAKYAHDARTLALMAAKIFAAAMWTDAYNEVHWNLSAEEAVECASGIMDAAIKNVKEAVDG